MAKSGHTVSKVAVTYGAFDCSQKCFIVLVPERLLRASASKDSKGNDAKMSSKLSQVTIPKASNEYLA